MSRYGAIPESLEDATQSNMFMVKTIECREKYEPHYEACCTVKHSSKEHALESVVNASVSI
ncbi:CLUMA_CG010155, isoform A [Clunio marinus]|uniref:CLUMA_CG010155, isoform A n=1 Tax=Clunio marinus TaxID=568069 RepID=A0A1J1ICE7_9DIPT|nr:CLUMA_CG010155, isoform A [Clunio marinus]